jgi:DNA (cytosine-5)-methyltransferase 1
MKRRLLLDLFCCAGGAAMGYHRAGFDVIGVDLEPQPNYPFHFIQADAMTFPFDGFDLVHASAPCRDHTPLTAVAGTDGTGWMLAGIRDRLAGSGIPWVLENVPGAPMRPDLVLCGKMFGLRVKRHRWFELSGDALVLSPPHPRHTVPTATRERRRRWAEGWDISVTGDVGTYCGPEAMGIDWMTGNELSQAIPPAYTEHIGLQLMEHLNALEAAA